MSRTRAFLAVFAFAWVAPPAVGGPPQPGVYEDNPPQEIKRLLDDLKNGKESAVKPLVELDAAAPYLRFEAKRAAATNLPRERLMKAALAPIEDRIHDRNKKRYARWAETGRIDLCTEFLVVCETKDGFALADLTLPLRERIREEFHQAVDVKGAGRKDRFCRPAFAKARNGLEEHFAGDDLTLNSENVGRGTHMVLVRADRCTVQLADCATWFVAARSELRHNVVSTIPPINPDSGNEWISSVVFVNSSLEGGRFTRAENSLIVCDGDLELRNHLVASCIIANGNIWADKDKRGSSDRCYLIATGNITLPKQKLVDGSAFHAGGAVTLAEKPKLTDRVTERKPVLPFGIRFFDPEELGITLATQKNGMKVTALEQDSPFAKYGIEVGDVIASIDGEKTLTPPEFRRQLRRGLIAESAVLRVKRGEGVLTRIVFFDGIPLPSAPMPREAAR